MLRPRPISILSVWLGLGACGPDDGIDGLAAVCGADGPVRVLALAPGEVHAGLARQVGDRTIYAVGEHGPPESPQVTPTITFTGLWSTGPCGESPILLDPDARLPFTNPRLPDLLLAWHENERDVLVVDPKGVAPSNVLFTGAASIKGWADAGIVAAEPQDESTEALYLHFYPDDPRSETAESVLLFEGRPRQEIGPNPTTLAVFPDEVFVRDVAGDLLSLSLPDGATTVLQTGVWSFQVSPDRRWMMWQDIKPIETDLPERPAGELYLRDMQSGEDTLLMTGVLSPSAFSGYASGLLVLSEGVNILDSLQRVYPLETLEYVTLPEQSSFFRPLPDGRWLLTSFLGLYPYSLFEPVSGAETKLQHSTGWLEGLHDDRLEVLDVEPCCGEGRTYFDEGPLWSVPFDGSSPRQLAPLATRLGMFVGTHRVDPLDIDEDGLGRLVVQDTASQTSSQIEARAFAYGLQPSTAHDNAVIYSVDDGERSGVYLARVEEE